MFIGSIFALNSHEVLLSQILGAIQVDKYTVDSFSLNHVEHFC